MITESEFIGAADRALAAIGAALDAALDDSATDVDWMLNDGILELECDEAVLTGESIPVEKTAAATDGDRSCALMGTIVREGSARGVVVRTGTNTGFGRIAAGLGERPAQTAFQVGLRQFSFMLVRVAGVLTASIFAINLVLHRPFLTALLFSLAIAIGLTPQLQF